MQTFALSLPVVVANFWFVLIFLSRLRCLLTKNKVKFYKLQCVHDGFPQNIELDVRVHVYARIYARIRLCGTSIIEVICAFGSNESLTQWSLCSSALSLASRSCSNVSTMVNLSAEWHVRIQHGRLSRVGKKFQLSEIWVPDGTRWFVKWSEEGKQCERHKKTSVCLFSTKSWKFIASQFKVQVSQPWVRLLFVEPRHEI